MFVLEQERGAVGGIHSKMNHNKKCIAKHYKKLCRVIQNKRHVWEPSMETAHMLQTSITNAAVLFCKAPLLCNNIFIATHMHNSTVSTIAIIQQR
jgi:hypothetical protein